MERPACFRCTSTGRACEGYPATSTVSQSQVHAVLPLVLSKALSVSRNPREDRCINFFHTQTAPQFSETFGNEFWNRLVLQVAERELCIRHAVVALGSLHEAFIQREQHDNSNSPLSIDSHKSTSMELACDHYIQALKILNTHIGSHYWKSVDIALLCCILCIGFEWLRGGYKAANTHLIGGLSVLRQWSESRDSGIGVAFSSPTGHLIRSQIAPVFTRMALQARTLDDRDAQIRPPSLLTEACQQGTESSIQVARKHLDILLCDIYLHPGNFDPSQVHLTDNTKVKFSARLAEWHKENHMHLCPPLLSEVLHDAITHPIHQSAPDRISLTLWYATLTIIVATSHTTDQMLYDAFLARFQQIIDLVEQLFSISSQSITVRNAPYRKARFRIDMESVPMLYLVAAKCRHPIIRRRAVALLRTGNFREGLWDGLAQARLSEEIISLEEGNGEQVVDEKSVAGTARICRISDETDLERRIMKVRFKRQGEVNFGPMRLLTF